MVGNTQTVVNMREKYPHRSVTPCLWNARYYYFNEILHANSAFLVGYSCIILIFLLYYYDIKTYWCIISFVVLWASLLHNNICYDDFFVLEWNVISVFYYYITHIYRIKCYKALLQSKKHRNLHVSGFFFYLSLSLRITKCYFRK